MDGNTGLQDEYIPNFSYEVHLGLILKIGFIKISNLSSDKEVEVIADGGNNDVMYFFEKPKRKPDTITFSKGLALGTGAGSLSWLVEGLRVNDIMIVIRRGKQAKRIFYIQQGILTKISFSDLDALNNQVMIKTMEMQHTGLIEIPLSL